MKNGDEIDRFKYSVMTITALSTFSYLLYNYFQNKPVNENLYVLAIFMISSAIICIMISISYIFIKGFANEIQNFYVKKIIDEFVPSIYKISFLITIILLFYSFILSYLYNTYYATSSNNQEINGNIFTLLLLLVIFTSYFLNILMVKKDTLELFFLKKKIKTPYPILELKDNEYFKYKIGQFINALIKFVNKIVNKLDSLNLRNLKILYSFKPLSITTLLYSIIFVVIYILMIHSFASVIIMNFMPGDVQIDIGNIHYKNDTQIPVLIQVTGPNTGLSIELLKEQSNNLSRIAYIDYLEPQHNLKISSNNNLVGNTLDFGKYSVFINTTNLTTGYYELKCVRPGYSRCTYESFYLLEDNHL